VYSTSYWRWLLVWLGDIRQGQREYQSKLYTAKEIAEVDNEGHRKHFVANIKYHFKSNNPRAD
jgi:hypothetical protein